MTAGFVRCTRFFKSSSEGLPHLNKPNPDLFPSPTPLNGCPEICCAGIPKNACCAACPDEIPHCRLAISAQVLGPTESVRAAFNALHWVRTVKAVSSGHLLLTKTSRTTHVVGKRG